MRLTKALLALAVLLLAVATVAAYAHQADTIIVIDADEVITTGTTEDQDLSNVIIDPRLFFRWVEQIQPLELLALPQIPQPLDRVFLRYAEHIQETALDTPPTVPNPLDRVLLRYVEYSQKTLLGPPPDAPDILDRIYLGHVEHGRKLSLQFPIGLVEARPPYWQVYLPVVLASW